MALSVAIQVLALMVRGRNLPSFTRSLGKSSDGNPSEIAFHLLSTKSQVNHI